MASTWPELHAGTNFNHVWDTGTLAWVKETQPGGGGGGGGAMTVADGADIAEGSTADVAVYDAAGTVNAHLRAIAKSVAAMQDGSRLRVERQDFPRVTGTLSGVGAGTVLPLLRTGTPAGLESGVCAIYLTNDGAFVGTVRVIAEVNGTLDLVNDLYNIEDGAATTTVPLDKLVAFPCAGYTRVGLYVTAYTSGTCSVELGAGPGSLNLPMGVQAVSATSLPLPTGASTEGTLLSIKAKTDNLDVALSTRTKPADQQHVIIDTIPVTAVTVATLPLPANAAQETGGALASLVAKDFATTAKQDISNTSLASIKTNTDPLLVAAGGAYVRQDNTGTIAKETGGNLDAIVTKLDVPLSTLATATGLTAATALLTLIEANQPSIQTLDGQTMAFGADILQRRLSEQLLLQAEAESFHSMLIGESENSERRGFELR